MKKPRDLEVKNLKALVVFNRNVFNQNLFAIKRMIENHKLLEALERINGLLSEAKEEGALLP